MHIAAGFQTFFAVLELYSGSYMFSFLNACVAIIFFLSGPGGINLIENTVARITLLRLYHDGVPDPKTVLFLMEDLSGRLSVVESQAIKPFDSELIRQKKVLQRMISLNFYIVWMNSFGYYINRNGNFIDKELLRAVLSGK